jgi:hypothetical protein
MRARGSSREVHQKCHTLLGCWIDREGTVLCHMIMFLEVTGLRNRLLLPLIFRTHKQGVIWSSPCRLSLNIDSSSHQIWPFRLVPQYFFIPQPVLACTEWYNPMARFPTLVPYFDGMTYWLTSTGVALFREPGSFTFKSVIVEKLYSSRECRCICIFSD